MSIVYEASAHYGKEKQLLIDLILLCRRHAAIQSHPTIMEKLSHRLSSGYDGYFLATPLWLI